MPPKRKAPASSAPKATTTKRRSKLAKENNITTEEETEIQEAFGIFAQKPDESSSEPLLLTSDVRRCLIALNAPPKNNAEMQEILETIDPDSTGWVGYEHFLAIAALKMHSRVEDPEAVREEVHRAFRLFTKGQDREINVGDLRRIAEELREEVPEGVLRDMVREATGGGVGGVRLEEFEDVMRRAGVFG